MAQASACARSSGRLRYFFRTYCNLKAQAVACAIFSYVLYLKAQADACANG
jgi:hypothetical protein